ncbi:hypothetical protein [Tumebacillus lipolyticus]|uniref:Uncharacterized protein n=1 Tax=Tumebacillus lipolyticus TaxID=1280370 RepID=A0ABW4ZVW4_9BACL
MKKRSLKSLAKGVGYSTAVFFDVIDQGRSLSKNGYRCDLPSFDSIGD